METQSTNTQEVSAHQDLGDISLMLGLDDRFSNMGSEIEDIYSWAKTTTGLPGGGEVLMIIKGVVDDMGSSIRGEELVRRLHRWTKLDSKIRELRINQMVLENGR